jgi:hypothetical protein
MRVWLLYWQNSLPELCPSLIAHTELFGAKPCVSATLRWKVPLPAYPQSLRDSWVQ